MRNGSAKWTYATEVKSIAAITISDLLMVNICIYSPSISKFNAEKLAAVWQAQGHWIAKKVVEVESSYCSFKNVVHFNS